MKKTKKYLVLLSAIVLIVAISFGPVFASVFGGSYSKNKILKHSGASSLTGFSVKIIFPNGFNNTRVWGTSKTKWRGDSPYNADSIQHTNIVSVTGLGGLSVSGTGGGGSTSGNQYIDSMTVNNTWQINSTFDYTVKMGIYILSSNFGTSGRVQLGSNFYSLSCST